MAAQSRAVALALTLSAFKKAGRAGASLGKSATSAAPRTMAAAPFPSGSASICRTEGAAPTTRLRAVTSTITAKDIIFFDGAGLIYSK